MMEEDFKSATVSVLNAIATMCDKWGCVESKIAKWLEARDGEDFNYRINEEDLSVGNVAHFHDEEKEEPIAFGAKNFEDIANSPLPRHLEGKFWLHDVEIINEFHCGVYMDSSFRIPVEPGSEEGRKVLLAYGKTKQAYNLVKNYLDYESEFMLVCESRLLATEGSMVDATGFLRAFAEKKAALAKIKEKTLKVIEAVANGSGERLERLIGRFNQYDVFYYSICKNAIQLKFVVDAIMFDQNNPMNWRNYCVFRSFQPKT